MKNIIATLLLAAIACTSNEASSTPSVIGQAPNFTARDINNNLFTLSDYHGQVLVINFWATWCGPCIAELPHLDILQLGYQALNKPVRVIAISIDEARLGSSVKSLVKSRKYSFTTIHDIDTSIVTQYAPSKSIPYTVIVNKEGNIVHTQLGYSPGVEDKYYEVIEGLLNE